MVYLLRFDALVVMVADCAVVLWVYYVRLACELVLVICDIVALWVDDCVVIIAF